jgi:hypothetical protein
LAEARRQYAAALAAADTTAGDEAEKQGLQAAALQAKITTRRRQVAMLVAQEQLTDQQRKDRASKVDRLKRELAAAQQAEAKANAAADASAGALSQARVELAAARESADKIAAAQREQVADEQGMETLRAQGERLQRELAKKVRPNDPGEDAVVVNASGEDPRLLRILYTGAGIVAFYSFLMWFTATGGNTPRQAERATYDVVQRRAPGAAGPRPAGSGNGPGADDDEHPLTV